MEFLDQEYVMLPVDKLRPHPFNPNRGDEQALAESVDASGFYGAVIVREHPDEEGAYQILGGEHRWRLTIKRGKTEIPSMLLTECDDVKAVRILLDDNEVGRRGSYDQDALDQALDSLQSMGGEDPLFDSILGSAGEKKDQEDEEERKQQNDDEDDEPYSDDDDPDSGFIQEYGVLVMADSELEQQDIFEYLAKTYGASKLRVVSI